MAKPRWDEPAVPFENRLVVVAFIAAMMEALRFRLHPESAMHPWLIAFSVAATMGLHLWSMPEDLKRAAVSALFTEATMPVIVGLIGVFLSELLKASLHFLSEFIPTA